MTYLIVLKQTEKQYKGRDRKATRTSQKCTNKVTNLPQASSEPVSVRNMVPS